MLLSQKSPCTTTEPSLLSVAAFLDPLDWMQCQRLTLQTACLPGTVFRKICSEPSVPEWASTAKGGVVVPRKPFCTSIFPPQNWMSRFLSLSWVLAFSQWAVGISFLFIVGSGTYDTTKVIVLQTWACSQKQSFPLVEPFFPLFLYWKLVICISLETHVQGSASLGQLWCIWNVAVPTHGMDRIGSRTN